jgi:hypothetical protein
MMFLLQGHDSGRQAVLGSWFWDKIRIKRITPVQSLYPATNNQQPTAKNQQPRTNSQEPTAKNQEPLSHKKSADLTARAR